MILLGSSSCFSKRAPIPSQRELVKHKLQKHPLSPINHAAPRNESSSRMLSLLGSSLLQKSIPSQPELVKHKPSRFINRAARAEGAPPETYTPSLPPIMQPRATGAPAPE